MKAIITANGGALDAPLDPRFGRAAHFILVDTESMEFEAHDNSVNLNAAQGAGIQAAETCVKLGAEAVVSGHCGPKAFRVLTTAGIKIYKTEGNSVEENIDRFLEDKLEELDEIHAGLHNH